jgi:hypothetical protein
LSGEDQADSAAFGMAWSKVMGSLMIGSTASNAP